MDTGRGDMVQISEVKAGELRSGGVRGVFQEGEVLEIKGSRFRVQSLHKKRMVLKILPSKENNDVDS